MKQVIFATGNSSKIKRFQEGLKDKNIELLSLRDVHLILDVEENGSTAIENALIKARACFKKTGKPSIGMDDTLYMENVPLDKQPGLFVRRVNGKSLTDEEMIKYYTSLVKEYGNDGRINSKWIYGLAVINELGEEATYTWSKDDFYMVSEPSPIINPGYPLNSISKYKILDKYFTDITDEDKEKIRINEDDVVAFIADHVGD